MQPTGLVPGSDTYGSGSGSGSGTAGGVVSPAGGGGALLAGGRPQLDPLSDERVVAIAANASGSRRFLVAVGTGHVYIARGRDGRSWSGGWLVWRLAGVVWWWSGGGWLRGWEQHLCSLLCPSQAPLSPTVSPPLPRMIPPGSGLSLVFYAPGVAALLQKLLT